jgi:hypothetical protein
LAFRGWIKTQVHFATLEVGLRACYQHDRVNFAVNISSINQINSQPCCVAPSCPALLKHVTHLKPKFKSTAIASFPFFQDNNDATQHADLLHKGLLPAGKLFPVSYPSFYLRHIEDKTRSSCGDAVNTPDSEL